ncbi:tho complex subunit 7 [Anaeramoeba ignava]|uniref:Tho complex subunit 7 n=1 Tax=Anaeramoeba ignava TaxID=1746090 RepID=A0A9Q0LH89_ANAIG|nr:tho complex subunit 7 [Anaeramoeba ignava]
MEDVIQKRIIANERVIGKLANMVIRFQEMFEENTYAECLEQYTEIINEITGLEIDLNKNDFIEEISEKEYIQTEKQVNELQLKLNKIFEQINLMQEQLNSEKQKKKNREEYNTISKLIEDYPPTSETLV